MIIREFPMYDGACELVEGDPKIILRKRNFQSEDMASEEGMS
jgi:hypothetical protein